MTWSPIKKGSVTVDFGSLDERIRLAVQVLVENGIKTFESCGGGEGHCFKYPTIRFEGDKTEGYRAFDVLAKHGFRVLYLQRQWAIENNEIGAPYWQLELAESGQPVALVNQDSLLQ